jgi:hypothetical protein
VPVRSVIAGREHEARTRIDHRVLVLQRQRGADRLEQRQHHRAVARVLGDLAAAASPSFLIACMLGSTTVIICRMIGVEM